MPRWIAVLRGISLLVTLPLAVMALRMLVGEMQGGVGPGNRTGLTMTLAAFLALLILNAALMVPASARIRLPLVVANAVLAPPVALFCYLGNFDPVALFLAFPFLSPAVVTVGTFLCASGKLSARRI